MKLRDLSKFELLNDINNSDPLKVFIYFIDISLDKSSGITSQKRRDIFNMYLDSISQLPNGSIEYICSNVINNTGFIFILNQIMNKFPDFTINKSCPKATLHSTVITEGTEGSESMRKKVTERNANKDYTIDKNGRKQFSLDKSLNIYIKNFLKNKKSKSK